MTYVIDSSVGFKWGVVELDTAKARKLRDDFQRGPLDLIAPDIFPIEIAHALTRAERQRRITPMQGAQFMRDILTTLPVLHPSLILLARAYEISSAQRVGVYDCLYIALAERESCQFVTADDKLVQRLAAVFPFITALSSLP